ncbi:hypothetical protein NL676_033896 [Syzygium grande]|nr:hypothetical protein NL676_033896 [Syzygium grande]
MVEAVPSDGESEGGCMIKWSFTVDFVEGWVLEELAREGLHHHPSPPLATIGRPTSTMADVATTACFGGLH